MSRIVQTWINENGMPSIYYRNCNDKEESDLEQLRIQRTKRVKTIEKKFLKFCNKYFKGNKDISNIYFKEQNLLANTNHEFNPVICISPHYDNKDLKIK